MSKYNVLVIRKLKSVRACVGAIQHNQRTRGNSRNDLTDAKVISLRSKGMIFSTMPYGEAINSRLNGKKPRKNATYGIELILSFSPGAITNENLKQWAKNCFEFVAENFGERNIYDASLHLSESTGHIHFLVQPFTDDDRMTSKVIDGRQKIKALHDQLYLKNRDLGLERGLPVEYTQTNHEDFKKWKKEQASKEKRLEKYEAYFGTEEDWDVDIQNDFEQCLERSERSGR